MCRQSAMGCQASPVSSGRGPDQTLTYRLGLLSDPRGRRGRRHPMLSVLMIAAAAVAGARSYAAIGQWARNTPQTTLTRVNARVLPAFGIQVAPSGATIRRVISLVCPGGLAELTGADPAAAESIAVDGKTARGSRVGDTPAAHLLAAMTNNGQVIAQLRVSDKTNEITCFADLLRPFGIAGTVITADALHTQRGHATFLVEEKNAHYLLTVKKNQPTLHERLRTMPWSRATVIHYDCSAGHGRKDTRVLTILTIHDLDFPHVQQIVRVVRHSRNTKTGKRTRETVYLITSRASAQASPERLARLIRSQWLIENRLHYVRDVTFGEDASQIRTGHGPENMATIRSLVINLFRKAGFNNIAEAIRDMSYDTFSRPLDLLGIA